MRNLQCGFTLVELAVTLGVTAILLAAGGIWMLGARPGSLLRTTDDVDAAMAAARALASAGNGATLVFAPRIHPIATGFLLTVYRGRPQPGSIVSPTTIMPVDSDASVAEPTLGLPPFSLFLGASGHVSGTAQYPQFINGVAHFTTIPKEPPCPSGGFVLRFSLTRRIVATRSIPCAANPLGRPGLPNPSPTPERPMVVPANLLFHWPADSRRHFAAVEWGYTHWFAAANGFDCGNAVAAFPDVLPSPYSQPATPQEGREAPSPPPLTPYSYPNSDGGSMNDAPADFPLDASSAGLCSATVADDSGQKAGAAVQVMGWLTAAYASRTYTHLSQPTLHLPSSAFGQKGASVTLRMSKTYDADPLQPVVSFDPGCAPYVQFSALPGTTPREPSAVPATASLLLTLVTMPSSKIECGGSIFDQYRGSLAGESVAFNATIGGPRCPDAGNVWIGPSDGVCYDLYAIATGMTQTPGWIEESLAGFYIGHGTPGTSIYQWSVGNGTCSLQQLGGTDFADWAILLSNGNPTPPPVSTPQPIANAAGFGVSYIPDTLPVTSAPKPDPTAPPPWLCRASPQPSTPP